MMMITTMEFQTGVKVAAVSSKSDTFSWSHFNKWFHVFTLDTSEDSNDTDRDAILNIDDDDDDNDGIPDDLDLDDDNDGIPDILEGSNGQDYYGRDNGPRSLVVPVGKTVRLQENTMCIISIKWFSMISFVTCSINRLCLSKIENRTPPKNWDYTFEIIIYSLEKQNRLCSAAPSIPASTIPGSWGNARTVAVTGTRGATREQVQ